MLLLTLLLQAPQASAAIACQCFRDVLWQHLLLCLPGREVREQMFNEVTSLLHDLDMGMLPISVLLPYLPIPAHNRRDK